MSTHSCDYLGCDVENDIHARDDFTPLATQRVNDAWAAVSPRHTVVPLRMAYERYPLAVLVSAEGLDDKTYETLTHNGGLANLVKQRCEYRTMPVIADSAAAEDVATDLAGLMADVGLDVTVSVVPLVTMEPMNATAQDGVW